MRRRPESMVPLAALAALAPWLATPAAAVAPAAAEPPVAAEPPAAVEAPAAAEPPAAAFDPGPGKVVVATIDAMMINRGSGEYLAEALETAQSDPEVRAFVLVLDTPGGGLEDTRLLVRQMLASDLPIIVYVSPPGSRAASAGVFLTMAAHVAAMAPATHLGAAHPVFVMPSLPRTGKDEDDEMAQQRKDSEAAMLDKVTEDTVSFVRNIAAQRGRNADWAERAVRDSVTAQVDEAVELGVVDLQAATLGELLRQVDGREVGLLDGRRVVLRTLGPVVHHRMHAAQRVLYMLTEPTVAWLLLMLGLMGLGIELRHPGLVAPGVIGALCLLLASFSLSALPVNALALVFVVLGAGLLVADFFVPSHGLLSIGGVASLAFGGLFLVRRTPEVPVGVSPLAVAIVAALTLLTALLVGWLVLHDRGRKVHTGEGGLLGARGRVTRPVLGGDEPGQVLVQGERWTARCQVPLRQGDSVVVLAIDGMTLRVGPEPQDP